MSTLSDAIRALQSDGYTGNWFATADGRLRCPEMGIDADPADVSVDRVLRFEGQSDPDDEVILFALSEPGGRRGLYSAQYGPSMPPEDVAMVRRLRTTDDIS
jgi:hypothetical protein